MNIGHACRSRTPPAWVQHAVAIHYATNDGDVIVAWLVRGPRLDVEDSLYKELCAAAGIGSAGSGS